MYPMCLQGQIRLSAPIGGLNSDLLLNVFYHYQLFFLKSYEDILSYPDWDNARWWYKPTQVCRQWRQTILASPLHLSLNLVCTYGTPVANMLAHSPPLPLIINYLSHVCEASTEDEEGILLALQYRDRVRRIGLQMPAMNLPKYIKAMDGQFPILERLFIWPLAREDTSLMLPKTLQAQHLGQLWLCYTALPAGSLLLTTTVGLTSLVLRYIPLSAYFHPSYLVARLSSMPQLECLIIGFDSPIPTHDVERQSLHTLLGTRITLPNLRLLDFRGVRAYLERVLDQIDTPLLEVLRIWLFNQLSFTFPHLFQFINGTNNLRFRFARIIFHRESVVLTADRREGDRVNPFDVVVSCRGLDWQVSAMAQIFNALVPVLSVMEGLALRYKEHNLPLERQNEVNRTQWHDLLRPFSGIKVLYVAGGLITKFAHSLQIEDGETPLELLPELKELAYYKDGDPSDAFDSFINARQIAGRPITLIHVPPPPSSWG